MEKMIIWCPFNRGKDCLLNSTSEPYFLTQQSGSQSTMHQNCMLKISDEVIGIGRKDEGRCCHFAFSLNKTDSSRHGLKNNLVQGKVGSLDWKIDTINDTTDRMIMRNHVLSHFDDVRLGKNFIFQNCGTICDQKSAVCSMIVSKPEKEQA